MYQNGLKNPTITWQGTQSEFIKLITRTNVQCLDFDIHKSKHVVGITHESKMGITYCSKVLTTKVGILNQLFIVWKHNSRILMHDQMLQPLIFYSLVSLP
jgi:hypothetical protein